MQGNARYLGRGMRVAKTMSRCFGKIVKGSTKGFSSELLSKEFHFAYQESRPQGANSKTHA